MAIRILKALFLGFVLILKDIKPVAFGFCRTSLTLVRASIKLLSALTNVVRTFVVIGLRKLSL